MKGILSWGFIQASVKRADCSSLRDLGYKNESVVYESFKSTITLQSEKLATQI